MKVGLKDISEMSGFSLATVSNVLNGRKGVNQQTAEKVLKIAKELGYFRGSKVEKVKLVIYKHHGMVVDETPFFNELIEGVEGECSRRELALEITSLHAGTIGFNQAVDRILNDFSSAVLLLATEMDEEDLSVFAKATIPIALLDGWVANSGFNATIINNKDSMTQAVRFMVEQGYKSFGYLKSVVPIYNFKSRFEGFKRGLDDYSSSFDDKFLVPLRPNMEGSYKDMTNYLKGANQLPEIYFADNDIIASGAMKALKSFGVKIPNDVAVVGFDDMPFFELASPALSTVRVFRDELGAQGVRNLLDNLDQTFAMNIKVSVSTELIIRESTKNKVV